MQAVTYQSFRDAPLMPVAGVKDAVLALQTGRRRDLRGKLRASPEKMRFTLGLTGLWDLFDGRIFSSSAGAARKAVSRSLPARRPRT